MWKSVNAKIQGTLHKKLDIPCQDYTTSSNKEEVYIIVLADGAGSAKHSERGAKIACEAVQSFISKNFISIYNTEAKEVKANLIHRIRTRLGIAAKKNNCNKDEFASTLLFVAVRHDMFICGHLGDGVIGIIDNQQQVRVLSLPENGEFANFTFFTTSKNYQYHLRLIKGKIDDIEAFLIMSDGAADCLFHKKTNQFANAVLLFSNWIKQYEHHKVSEAIKDNMEKIFSQYTTDDCSINILQKTCFFVREV